MNGKMLDKLQTLKVLYAEDEEGIRKNIADSLRYYVKEVFETSNGDEAYRIYQDKAPDIILSDIHMPILNGIELVKKIREQDRKTPIIMITAHIDKKYLMDAVELHMEKYLVKPIDLDILLQTLEKCVSILDINNIVKLEVDKDYSYDFDKKELYYKNKSINLNKKEMLFFEVLIKNQRKITTYEELQSRVWDADIMTDSALRSLVRNLRKKLPTDIIINISGLGYRFA
ncbi:response regulator transcription factor [Campylobacter hyointestinalis]|uniref:DNA-binding response regulator n=2 Tax=Campylobacter hyointestinalis TaxID=198 RepID=A0A855N1D1_CAMHY|nr:response regulator transcription factor [Campylobacter hyointestinalis]MBT0612643.1 response regulator transcription factor [Campylobacter hyointestinalis subsp. hyointestinalis]MDY2999165.1 response regulator transcription factor [Campylobacter hyointestinalis]PPB52283.1 DNA-binding response regulator [Campylobacter hyointestinalis subsp. hyointestinalis]PPB52654.1 DNA-binding response regulator [Campylobacter hyointestinalis subsp. hyointestinalis]PPB56480.1 DNA-binding response regulator